MFIPINLSSLYFILSKMHSKYIKAVSSIQKLFHELVKEDKLSPTQIDLFNQDQKVLVNYNQWVKNQLSGNQKIELPWDTETFKSKWLEWKKHHKQKTHKDYTPVGEKGALTHLATMSNNDEAKAIINIDFSIKNNWSGIYEYKQCNKKAGTHAGQKLTNQKPKEYGGW